MTETPFETRVRATGLRLGPDDMPGLEALVADLDRIAEALRGPRPYTEEPRSVFRLKRAEHAPA